MADEIKVVTKPFVAGRPFETTSSMPPNPYFAGGTPQPAQAIPTDSAGTPMVSEVTSQDIKPAPTVVKLPEPPKMQTYNVAGQEGVQVQFIQGNSLARVVTPQGSYSIPKERININETQIPTTDMPEEVRPSARIETLEKNVTPIGRTFRTEPSAIMRTSSTSGLEELRNRLSIPKAKSYISSAKPFELTPEEKFYNIDLSQRGRGITFEDIQFSSEPLYSIKDITSGESIGQQIVFGAGLTALTFVRSNVEFGQALATNPVSTVTSIPESIITSFKTPAGIASLATQTILTTKAFEGITSAVKNVYIAAGAERIPIESVTTQGVISGKEPMPLVRSVSEAQARFDAARMFNYGIEEKYARGIRVSTASPSALKGGEVGVFGKAAAGLEDTGIYVTPEGEASLYFTGVRSLENAPYEISVNPFKNVFKIPTVTTFEVTDVVRYPRGVIREAGFAHLEKFQREVLAPKAEAVITKRSEIGLGEIPRQRFKATADFTSDTGKLSVKKGQIRMEAGTSEIEAVIPVGAKFSYVKPTSAISRLKGFEKYTKFGGDRFFQGKNIALRDAIVEGENTARSQRISLSAEQIAKETESLSSTLSGSKIVSPSIFISSQTRVSQSSSIRSRTSSFSKLSQVSNVSKPQSEASYITSKLSSSPSVVSGLSSASSISRFSKISEPTSSTGSSTSITTSSLPSLPFIPPEKKKKPIIKKERFMSKSSQKFGLGKIVPIKENIGIISEFQSRARFGGATLGGKRPTGSGATREQISRGLYSAGETIAAGGGFRIGNFKLKQSKINKRRKLL